MSDETKTLVFEVSPEIHRSIKYVAQVEGTSMKAASATLMASAIEALKTDPAWAERAQAFEASRSAGLSGLGIAQPTPPETPESTTTPPTATAPAASPAVADNDALDAVT